MDIDIDTSTNFDFQKLFLEAVPASMIKNDQLVKHPTGAYFQTIPKDKITNLASIPYQKAEELGFIKVDFLHLSLLNYFENKQEIRILLKKEPDWVLLENILVVSKLFQIHKHFNIVQQVKPKSIQELADVISLIRPNKRELLPAYLKNRKLIRDNLLYKKIENDKSSFKKGHAIVYSMNIVLQMHLIKAKII